MWWAKIGMLVNLGLRKVEWKRFKVSWFVPGCEKDWIRRQIEAELDNIWLQGLLYMADLWFFRGWSDGLMHTNLQRKLGFF
jgi:hypothetical protein